MNTATVTIRAALADLNSRANELRGIASDARELKPCSRGRTLIRDVELMALAIDDLADEIRRTLRDEDREL